MILRTLGWSRCRSYSWSQKGSADWGGRLVSVWRSHPLFWRRWRGCGPLGQPTMKWFCCGRCETGRITRVAVQWGVGTGRDGRRSRATISIRLRKSKTGRGVTIILCLGQTARLFTVGIRGSTAGPLFRWTSLDKEFVRGEVPCCLEECGSGRECLCRSQFPDWSSRGERLND